MKKYVDKAVSWDRPGITFDQIRPFQKANNRKAFLQVLGFLGLLGFTALAVLFSALQGWWLAFALALYVHGGLSSFCSSAIHELTHHTMFTKKSYNLFFACLFSLLYWKMNYAFYRVSHAKHHAYTQMQISDGEILPPVVFTKKQFWAGLSPFIPLIFVRSCCQLLAMRPLLFLRAFRFTAWQKHVLQTSKTKVVHEIYQWAYITLLFHLAVMLIALITGFWLLPVIITLAPFYMELKNGKVC